MDSTPEENPAETAPTPAASGDPAPLVPAETPQGPPEESPWQGPFERPLSGQREAVPGALLRVFAEGSRGVQPLSAAPGQPGMAGLIPFGVEEGALHYGGSFAGISPLFSPALSVPARLTALAAVSQRLVTLHQGGRVHGDLRPDTIWCGLGNANLVCAAEAFEPAALIRARLVAGAHPASVGFAAPEVVSGAPATPASDVYSIAALAVWAIGGRIPLGQFDLRELTLGLGAELGPLLTRALAPAPERRPALSGLCAALGRLAQPGSLGAPAEVRAGSSAPTTSPAPHEEAFEPAWREPEEATPSPKISGLLMVVLALGGVFVFCGLLWLVLTAWVVAGPLAQALILGLITAGTAGIGLRLEKHGFQRSGLTLLLLATQLVWVNGLHAQVSSDLLDEKLAVGVLGLLVAACSVLLASRRQSLLSGYLSAGASTISAIACAIYLSTGSVYGALIYCGAVGVLFGLATLGLGRLVPPRPSALEQPYAVASLGWLAISAFAAVQVTSSKGWGPLDAAWPYAVLGLLLLAALRLTPRLATFAWAGVGLTSLLVPMAHATLVADKVSKPALVAYLTVVALGFAGLALGLGREPAEPSPDVDPAQADSGLAASPTHRAVVTGLWGLLAGAAAFAAAVAAASFPDYDPAPLDLVWPYALALGVAAAALRAPRRIALPAWVSLLGQALVIPVLHGEVASREGPYALLGYAALIGAVFFGIALLAESKRDLLEGRGPGAALDAPAGAFISQVASHLSVLWALAALVWFGVSIAASLYRWDASGGLFCLAWPYLVAAGLLVLSLRGPKRLAPVGLLGLSLCLLIVPMSHAVISRLRVPGLLWVILVGAILLVLAFRLARVKEHVAGQLAVIGVGLLNVILLPGVRALDACFGKPGHELLADAANHVGRFHESILIYLSMPLGASFGLVAMGFIFSRQAARRLPYRVLEVAGLLNAFLLLSVLSLGDLQADFFYVGLFFLAALLTLGVGVYAKRAMLVGVATVALLLNLFVHYFAKLTAAGAPWALEAFGFGVALLVLGISYERWVKDFLPRLKEWK